MPRLNLEVDAVAKDAPLSLVPFKILAPFLY